VTTVKNDGGPAFPKHVFADDDLDGESYIESKGGMSLRDYFAAKWLSTTVVIGKASADEIAAQCYLMADAMLRTREAGK